MWQRGRWAEKDDAADELASILAALRVGRDTPMGQSSFQH